VDNSIVKYETSGGEIELSPQIVRQYLVSGQGNVSDQEVMMFLNLCKFQRLNPFLREAYLIKYGNSPATIVTGKEAFTKRATRNQHYRGHKVGASPDGLVAWAEVYRDDYDIPIRVEVDYDEYVGRKGDGSITAMWKNKPKTMLKKVALVQALREAFPDDFGGMYFEEELGVSASEPTTKTMREPRQVGDAPVLISDNQRTAMFAKGRAAGFTDDDIRAFIVDVVGHNIESTKELTSEEASNILDALDLLPVEPADDQKPKTRGRKKKETTPEPPEEEPFLPTPPAESAEPPVEEPPASGNDDDLFD